VRADTATVLLKLSAAQLETFEAHDPSLAAALYRMFVQQMASRVEQLTVQAHQLSR
jgi:CRP-like cAMP-binding protein